ALADLTPLEADKRVLSYQPYWAAKGHLLARAGDAAPAVEALTIAVGLTTDEALKAYLLKRLASLRAT
ncbi:MAG TPA: hypothetical protein VL242_20815, partial [Sorangium sp.]|nr:hypothetical protein [Sorangium sp.]